VVTYVPRRRGRGIRMMTTQDDPDREAVEKSLLRRP
jgi:hypothetical protein